MRNSIEDYASTEIRSIWSAEQRVVVERRLWVLVMQLQADAGVDIPEKAIQSYEREIELVDLAQIAELELTTRHDLRARLEAFNWNAGYNHAHWGLTSCDITDNATQIQIKLSVRHLFDLAKGVLTLLGAHIEATRDVICVARTHNLPAQPTLLAKRFASIADELMSAMATVRMMFDAMPCRGLVGAVGTAQDLVTLLGSRDSYTKLNETFIDALGFESRYLSTGQVYPRSDDATLCSALVGLLAAPANLARMVRLETGYGRMWEHFDDGQVGSSAMPHKRNSVIAERVNGLCSVAQGFNAMLGTTSGAQWFEGDVSDSVTRRIGLPGLFYALDATLDNTVELLARLELSKIEYREEALAASWQTRSGELLSVALRHGADRDQAYELIKTGPIPDEWANELTFDLSEANDQVDRVLEVLTDVLG